MRNFALDWWDRINTRETVLLVLAVVLIATDVVDTPEEAVAMVGTFGTFIGAAQIRKGMGAGRTH